MQTPVSAVVDGGGGLGHVPAHFAMSTAITKAETVGMAAVAVRSSAHFGAAGFYTLMAANAGLVGMACTSASNIQVVPTFGKQAWLGTDPWSFAAPSADGVPFLLDMATTTVAAGRIRNKVNEKLPAPDGWLLDREGRPSNDPLVAKEKGGFLTSLGGSPENSSYKGHGLAVMVNILASCLSGATLITDPEHTKKPVGTDIGHFFMAIDPAIFRGGDVSGGAQGHRPDRPDTAGDDRRRSTVETGRDATAEWHTGRCRLTGAGPTNSAGRCGPLAARLIVLRHEFRRRGLVCMGLVQQGQRDRSVRRPTLRRRRSVAMECGTWRSGRSGGASGSVALGKGRFFAEISGARRRGGKSASFGD